jgi:DNA-directed RNA polymerase subunit beta'
MFITQLTNELIIESGEMINEAVAQLIEDSPIDSVEIRSVLTCERRRGVCVKCYGRNLATNRTAELGMLLVSLLLSLLVSQVHS